MKPTIIHVRYWGNINRHAEISVLNNQITVRGFHIGYRNRPLNGPVLENIAEVPENLRNEVQAKCEHRKIESSKDYSEFIDEIWKKAKSLNDWFNY